MISGFTFVRHGVKLGFPFEESIRSLLPLVDELVVNVGKGDDGTLEKVQALAAADSRIRVVESVWDESVRKEGRILAQQTDIAMKHCRGGWGVYIQADEVLHEEDIPAIRAALLAADKDPAVDGLLFDYLHFYGSFSVINRNPSAYRCEIRAVRLGAGVRSYRDAQGFRKEAAGELVKLRVRRSGARMFHYGWVRPQPVMQEKTKIMDSFYTEGGGTGENYRYKRIFGLERFTGTHPAVMQGHIRAASAWEIDPMQQPLVFRPDDIRKVLAYGWEKLTGRLPFVYKNYREI